MASAARVRRGALSTAVGIEMSIERRHSVGTMLVPGGEPVNGDGSTNGVTLTARWRGMQAEATTETDSHDAGLPPLAK